MKTVYQIKHTGMGGFMNPPKHAEHDYSVSEYSGSTETGSYSLSYALDSSWIPDTIKERCRALLDEFPGEYTGEWEESLYAYFRNCYSPDGVERNAGKLLISPAYPIPEHHAAYLFSKKFFPNIAPRLDLIANPPSWGNKKEVTIK